MCSCTAQTLTCSVQPYCCLPCHAYNTILIAMCSFDPATCDINELKRLLTFASKFVNSLHLQQLPSHLDLQIIFDAMRRYPALQVLTYRLILQYQIAMHAMLTFSHLRTAEWLCLNARLQVACNFRCTPERQPLPQKPVTGIAISGKHVPASNSILWSCLTLEVAQLYCADISHGQLPALLAFLPFATLCILQLCHGMKLCCCSGVSHFSLTYGLRNTGMNYDRALFGMKLPDCRSLAKTLEKSETLVSLALPGNLLEDDKIRMIASGLVDNHSVTNLDLSHNKVLSSCIATWLCTCYTLHHVADLDCAHKLKCAIKPIMLPPLWRLCSGDISKLLF